MDTLNRFPRMMQEYLTRRLRANYRANHQRVMNLKTRQDALDYVEEVRAKVLQIFPNIPERTPLNIQITGEIDRGDYVIQKLIFDSRPRFPVTANLYLPRGFEGHRPAALCLCGHRWDAKAYEPYQSFVQSLARMGYIALMFDPMGQFERLQYPDGKGGSLMGDNYPSVIEHNEAGKQMLLVDEWLSTWFAYDGIRALDVLLQQDGVDKTRVGVSGNSGGGNMTAFAVACDNRITMSAPCCYVTSWYHNGVNEEPQDSEQLPPGALGLGLEQSDLLIAGAPKPVVLLTEEQDFFDQRGSLEAFERLRHVYRLLGAEENVAYHVGPGNHGYHKDAREAMYAFFNKHAGIDASSTEPELVIEEVKTLQCTESGQVSDTGAKCVSDFTREKSKRLAVERGTPSGDELKQRVLALLNLPPRNGPPEYRVLRPWDDRKYARPHANQFVLETDAEFEAQAIVTKLEDEWRTARPLRGDGVAMLYVPHLSSDHELRDDAWVRRMEEEYKAFFACDYRGIGESRPDTCYPNIFFHPYGSDYHYASYACMLGDSYVAWRVHDLLCTLDWMASFGYDEVHLAAQGWGTIPGALAALLDDRVQSVTLKGAPASYSELAETKLIKWPASAMLPRVLAHFDLTDVYSGLEQKNLQLVREN